MLIGNRKIKRGVVKQLVEEIKKKKEFGYLADDFVEESLKRYLAQEAKLVTFLQGDFTEKTAKYKQIVKKVRGELRKIHGLFKIQVNIARRREYFAELLKTKPGERAFLKWHKKILETHSSTRERLPFYRKLYKEIFKITGKPKMIIDLGSALNPFSIPLMDLEKITYHAYDVDSDEMQLLQTYFDFLKKNRKGFKGKAGLLDLRLWRKMQELEKADVCFLWKATDVLDRQKSHTASERVIVNVPAKFVVVSFPTYTVQGKKMNYPRRKWIELMCERLGYSFKLIKKKNEIFYIIRKI